LGGEHVGDNAVALVVSTVTVLIAAHCSVVLVGMTVLFELPLKYYYWNSVRAVAVVVGAAALVAVALFIVAANTPRNSATLA
jgi:hypothetical protein